MAYRSRTRSSSVLPNWAWTTRPAFTLASVNAQIGHGFDNIVSLKGINYNGKAAATGWASTMSS